jgi:uncharacterized membrane protein YtjA (UPF0391 family)
MVVYAIALLVVALSAAMLEFERLAGLDADFGYVSAVIAALLFIIVLFELGRGAP